MLVLLQELGGIIALLQLVKFYASTRPTRLVADFPASDNQPAGAVNLKWIE